MVLWNHQRPTLLGGGGGRNALISRLSEQAKDHKSPFKVSVSTNFVAY